MKAQQKTRTGSGARGIYLTRCWSAAHIRRADPPLSRDGNPDSRRTMGHERTSSFQPFYVFKEALRHFAHQTDDIISVWVFQVAVGLFLLNIKTLNVKLSTVCF